MFFCFVFLFCFIDFAVLSDIAEFEDIKKHLSCYDGQVFVQHLYRSLFHAGIVAACMQRVHVRVGALLDFF